MLQIGLIIGLVLGFMLRGWLERTFPWFFRMFRKKRDDDDRPNGRPRSLVDRALDLKDRYFGKSKDRDDNDKGGRS
jgi:hypothetical protein